MAAKIIYFGEDHCHRVQVLRSAGFVVCHCLCLQDIRLRLRASPGVSAVLADWGEVGSDLQLVTDTRALCAAPIVLFVRSDAEVAADHFDLIIRGLTSPHSWLKELSLAIELYRQRRSEHTWRRPPVSIADGPRLRESARGAHGSSEKITLPTSGQ